MKYSHPYYLYLFIPAIILLQISCSDTNIAPNTYKGRYFEINYFRTDTLENKDWIQVDTTRFTHYRYPQQIMEDPFGIPTSIILKDSLSPDQKLEAGFNSISIAIRIADKLVTIGREDSSTKGRYVISNKPLLMTHGRIWLHRRDSSVFTIKTSEGYPAQVKEVEFKN